MKRFGFLLASVLFMLSLNLPVLAQEEAAPATMQMYHLVVVKHGSNWVAPDTGEGKDIRKEIIIKLRQAAEEGLVVSAGLVDDETDVEFILILNVETKSQAIKLLNASENYKNGMFVAEIYSMFAPTGMTVGQGE